MDTRKPRCASASRNRATLSIGSSRAECSAAGVASAEARGGSRARFVVFNQQFLTLIRAGLPILTALELLIKRQKDDTLKQLLENVRERVKGGELLSDAFAAQGMFPKMYTTTLMAGEKCGNMEEVLGALHRVSAPGHDLSKEAAGFAGLSHAADHRLC